MAVKPSPLGPQQQQQRDQEPAVPQEQEQQQWQAAPYPSRATLLTSQPDSMFQLSPEGSAASLGKTLQAQVSGLQEGPAARE